MKVLTIRVETYASKMYKYYATLNVKILYIYKSFASKVVRTYP